MEIVSNTVYSHPDHGEVLVTAVFRKYGVYVEGCGGAIPGEWYVQYATDWDSGQRPAGPVGDVTEPVSKFIDSVRST